MKINQILFLLLILLSSCKSESKVETTQKTSPQQHTQTAEARQEKSKEFDIYCKDVDPNFRKESELVGMLNKLTKLENKYKIVKTKKIDIRSSDLYRAFRRLPQSKVVDFNIKRLDRLKGLIAEMKTCSIVGQKDLDKKLFAKADVTEYIFKSRTCAKKIADYLETVKATESAWEVVDKVPTSLFRVDNKIYYVRTGGWYMKDFYQEIEQTMKN